MQEIKIKTIEEILNIRRAGQLVGNCYAALQKKMVAGIKTIDINQYIEEYLLKHGATPAQKGYKGYPYASCISVNEVACHGFPNDYILKSGDLVTVDFVADVGGWKADAAHTYLIGKGSEEAKRIMRAARETMKAGIAAAQVDRELADIGYAIERCAERLGVGVVTAFTGHGIGKNIHEAPQVVHTRSKTTGVKLVEGMVITIEPIVTAGSTDIYIDQDRWTARTVDHSLTAQFEHTILITKRGAKILTAPTIKSKKPSHSSAKKSSKHLS